MVGVNPFSPMSRRKWKDFRLFRSDYSVPLVWLAPVVPVPVQIPVVPVVAVAPNAVQILIIRSVRAGRAGYPVGVVPVIPNAVQIPIKTISTSLPSMPIGRSYRLRGGES